MNVVNPVQLFLTSAAFDHMQRIPRRHTCDGEDVSPELTWHGVPDETRTFALLMEDPDAPRGVFTHWIYYNIPGSLRELPEDVDKAQHPSTGGEQGLNDFGTIGYMGPCPPPGPIHHYHLILFALDGSLELAPRCSGQALRRAMQGHVLAEGELIGVYGRGRHA